MKRINFPAIAGSRKMWEKSTLKLFLTVFLTGFVFMSFVLAEELTEQAKVTPLAQESKDSIRIIITTSGLAKFNSSWQDVPPRLIVEFQTRNIVSKIGNEVMVNQGVIKKIVSSYFEEDPKRPLKSLAFELTQKVPYKIWQETDTILLDIQTPQELSVFPDEGSVVFTKNEPKDAIIKRLEVMDTALKQVAVIPMPLEVLTPVPSEAAAPASPVVVTQTLSEVHKPKVSKSAIESPKAKRKEKTGSISWFVGLVLLVGLGFLLKQRWDKPIFISKIRILIDTFKRKFKIRTKKDILSVEIARLKVELEQKNKLFEQEEIIRKAIENTSISRQKEFEQVKEELEKGKQLLEQEEKVRKTAEEELSQKEKELTEVKGSLESLKEVLVEKGIAKELTIPEKEGELWIAGKSTEKRELPRLDLTRDYNRTIILRIGSQDKYKSIKSFANNISSEGLCFETRHEFKEKDKIDVRLFFFGDKVPMMRLQAKVMWSKMDSPVNPVRNTKFPNMKYKISNGVNRYGVYFTKLEERDKTELNRYIESIRRRPHTYA